ncbi:MAG: hypothetical protein ACR2OG_01910 [Gemmatimonadaceae bacterium]
MTSRDAAPTVLRHVSQIEGRVLWVHADTVLLEPTSARDDADNYLILSHHLVTKLLIDSTAVIQVRRGDFDKTVLFVLGFGALLVIVINILVARSLAAS